MNDPILFLDIDGVLNSEEWALKVGYGRPARHIHDVHVDWLRWNPEMVGELKRIILATGAKIVLSTSWRHHSPTEYWPKCFALYDFLDAPIFGKTPDLVIRRRPQGLMYEQSHRGAEVQAWRKANDHTGPYVILDDGTDFYPEQPLIWCDPEHGLTESLADWAIEVLQGKEYRWDGYLTEEHRVKGGKKGEGNPLT